MTTTHQLRKLSIDEIVPYPNNPRQWSDADIARVAESINSYGYQAPIIVNQDNVIVVGHLRHQALRRLGVREVTVLVTDLPPDKEAEYRVIDNRAGELVAWNHDLLIPELREFTNPEHLEMFFPEIDLTMDFSSESYLLDENDIVDAQSALDKRMASKERDTRDITCPHCGHEFSVTS